MDRQDSNTEGKGMGDEHTTNDRLAALEALLARQDERMAQQEAEIEQLRAALGATQPDVAPTAPATEAPGGLASRRTLLKLGGAAAVAGVAAGAAAITHQAYAAPATVNNWTTSTFTADAETVVKPNNSSYAPLDLLQLQLGTGSVYAGLGTQLNAAKAALSAYDTTTNNIGVYATSSTGFGLFGVTDIGTGATGAGLNGTANSTGTGVSGNSQSGIGVQGNSATSIGGSFTGGSAPLYLGPGLAAGAPGGTHAKGELYLDNNAAMWICVAGGTPGTWVRVATVPNGAKGGGIAYLSTPVRLLDARTSASSGLVNRGALAGNELYTFFVAGLGGSGIPSNAQGLIANVTVLGPSAAGNLSLFPAGGAIPTVASMTFGSPGLFLANGVNVAVGSGGSINIQNQSGGTTPLVLDAVAFIS
jgi:hypothetical protein